MEIVVQPTGWELEIAEMQTLLENVVQHFLRYFANPPTGRIKVEYRADGPPMAVFRASRADDYRILLPTRGRLWAQCSYQFAHEFCHILCDFEKPRSSSNNWFQESLCELASLFALKQMAASWQTAAPYPYWSTYVPRLEEYVDEFMNRREHRLSDDNVLGGWLAANEPTLRADSCVRPLNAVVAINLLPLFEAEPHRWESVQYLPDSGDSFDKFLLEWQRACPDQHKEFVAKIADAFGIKL